MFQPVSSEPFFTWISFLVKIIHFIFLSPWGWLLWGIAFLSVLIRNMKDPDGNISFASSIAGISTTFLWFFSQGIVLIFSVLILTALTSLVSLGTEVQRSFELNRQKTLLQATLKNLKSERLIAKAKVRQVGDQIQATLQFYTWLPVSEKNKLSKEVSYTLNGNKVYLDFGVINFKHSLVENGTKINLAFPNQLYSDVLPPSEGINLLKEDKTIPSVFKLDKEEIFILTKKEYTENIRWLFRAATNASEARKMGIRTLYGQAFSLKPSQKKVYEFYATGTGGMIQKTK